jgi:hypothetical protein
MKRNIIVVEENEGLIRVPAEIMAPAGRLLENQ